MTFLKPDRNYGCTIDAFAKSTLEQTLINLIEFCPLNIYQIFFNSLPEDRDILKSRDIIKSFERILYLHGSLKHNLAGSTDFREDRRFTQKLDWTLKNLTQELDIMVALGGEGVVVHIGVCKNKKGGIYTIAKSVEFVLTTVSPITQRLAKLIGIPIQQFIKKRKLLLENAAGEKHKIGSSLQDISDILSLVSSPVKAQIGVCIDTAHIFAAGEYNFGVNTFEEFIEIFDKVIGKNYLTLFHLNDSKIPYGGHADRHEVLCEGHIFDKTSLGKFVKQTRAKAIPIIGETDDWFADYSLINALSPMEESLEKL